MSCSQIGTDLAASGNHGNTREWLEHALLIIEDSDGLRFNVACTYCQLGEIDLAIDELEKVVAIAGPDALHWIEADSDLDPIRDHPRYQLIQQVHKAVLGTIRSSDRCR